MTSKKLNIFDLLDIVRRRPGLYTGHHSPTHLNSFLNGYLLGTNDNLRKTKHLDFYDFNDWVAGKLGYSTSTRGWAMMIEEQQEDKEEGLWLFFELLDEFRGIKHDLAYFIDYSSRYTPNAQGNYSRKRKIHGNLESIPKPRPARLIIRKMNLNEIYYSLIALNDNNKVLDVKNSGDLNLIFDCAKTIYGVPRNRWKDKQIEKKLNS